MLCLTKIINFAANKWFLQISILSFITASLLIRNVKNVKFQICALWAHNLTMRLNSNIFKK